MVTARGQGCPPKKAVAESSGMMSKRGRGRPPKVVGESSAVVAKRGRGRPPKCGHGDGGAASSLKILGSRIPSPARSESPEGGYWDEFPISEFLLTLYGPIQSTQWLPQAVADALEGEVPSGSFFTELELGKDPGRCSPAPSSARRVERFAGRRSSSAAGRASPSSTAWRLPSSSAFS